MSNSQSNLPDARPGPQESETGHSADNGPAVIANISAAALNTARVLQKTAQRAIDQNQAAATKTEIQPPKDTTPVNTGAPRSHIDFIA